MSLTQKSDVELIAGFRDLVIDRQENLVDHLEYILELDRRKLYGRHSSLWVYLVKEFGKEEWDSERMIRAARFMARFPEAKAGLASGKLNLSLLEIAMGCAHREKLSDPELGELLVGIAGMSCKNARREIASRFPNSKELPNDRVRPITAEHYEVRFVTDEALLEKVEKARGLLAHSHLGIKLSELFDIALTEFLERHHPEEKAKRAQKRKSKKSDKAETQNAGETNVDGESPTSTWAIPNSGKRVPSEPLKHELTLAEGYVCAYVDPMTQQRCTSSFGLEVDHVRAWADGGKTELSNLRYLCPGHHWRVSYLRFGDGSKYRGNHMENDH